MAQESQKAGVGNGLFLGQSIKKKKKKKKKKKNKKIFYRKKIFVLINISHILEFFIFPGLTHKIKKEKKNHKAKQIKKNNSQNPKYPITY